MFQNGLSPRRGPTLSANCCYNTFLNNAHAQSTSNDERACVFVFSPLGQGLSLGSSFSLAGQPLAPHPLVGVARGWPSRMESVICKMESGNEEGQIRVPACCKGVTLPLTPYVVRAATGVKKS